MRLHLWWNRMAGSLTFSWAVTDTCFHLVCISSAFLPPDFLTTLQMLLTFLSVRTLSFSLMSNLAALELNPSQRYISLSHKAIISCLCVWYMCWICYATLHLIDLWHIVHWWGSSIFTYSVSEFTSFFTWLTGLIAGSDPIWYIVNIRLIACYAFAFCGIFLFILQRNAGNCVSIFFLFIILAIMTTASLTEMCCYYCSDNYISCREFQCWLTIINLLT